MRVFAPSYHFCAWASRAFRERLAAYSPYHMSTFWLKESASLLPFWARKFSLSSEKSRICQSFSPSPAAAARFSGRINVPPDTSPFAGRLNITSRIVKSGLHRTTFAALFHKRMNKRSAPLPHRSLNSMTRSSPICERLSIFAPLIFDLRNSIKRRGLSFRLIFLFVS